MLRREFVRSVPLAFAGAVLQGTTPASQSPLKSWNIVAHGARADVTTINTAAIQRVLDQAAADGGGIVRVPAGTFVTGSLRLSSNITLYLEPGAVLKASPSFADYPKEGPRHLLAASGCRNVTLTGAGTLDGNAEAFLKPAKSRMRFSAEKEWLDVAIFDWEPVRSMAAMVAFERCTEVVVSGITLRHSPRWTLHLDRCDTARVEGVRIRNLPYTPESDGIDIVCSRNVEVRGCDIATGDDAICLKSEGPGDLLPTQNIVVTHCTLTGCCNGFKIGTGSHGVFKNIRFTDSVVANATRQPPRERILGAVCIEMVDGGRLEDVHVRGIQIRNSRAPLFVRLGARAGGRGALREVSFENITATGALSASAICGIPGNPVSGIRLRNVQLGSADGAGERWANQAVPELVEKYPEALMFERLPAYGLYVRHAEGIALSGVRLVTEKPDGRPALVLDDAQEIDLADVSATPPASSQATVLANNTGSMFVHGNRAIKGTKTFLRITGARSREITLGRNDFSLAAHPVDADDQSAVRHPLKTF